MRTYIVVAMACAFLSIGNAAGKVSARAIEEQIKKFKQELTETIDEFINSADQEALEKLKKMLPAGPKDEYRGIEKDIFTGNLEENITTIKILEEKIDLLQKKKRKKKKELNKLLKSQKLVRKKWKRFWR